MLPIGEVKQLVRQDTGRLAWFIAGAVFCGLVALWAYTTIGWDVARWGTIAIATVVAALVLFYGRSSSGVVDCPSCDLLMRGVALRDNPGVLCVQCGGYATGSNGSIDVTPQAYVAPRPVFAADLPEELSWPEGCTVCGAPATRSVDVDLVQDENASFGTDLAVRAGSFGVLKAINRTTYRLQAPHCSEHHDGVALDHSNNHGSVDVVIAFRSYPYFREFVRLNRLEPRRLLINM